ncbi:MAG TPA: SGNH/GDSL hydrolase family protein, partial [Cytophagaceae bacterium]
MKKYNCVYLLVALLVFSCKPDVEEFKGSSGNANFTTYVALGNSLTAGYTDGALYREGQINSFPNILAKQLDLVVDGNFAFKQPLMPDDLGLGIVSPTILVNKRVLQPTSDCKGVTSLSPVPAGVITNPTPYISSVYAQGPYHNLGVPGAKSFHLLTPQFGNPAPNTGNPFYVRFASDPGTSTVIGDALALNPTFFTLWIGNNDILNYAFAGGESDSITPTTTFAGSIDAILGNLSNTAMAEGAIANIPDLLSIPYFNTVPAFGLAITRQGQLDSLKGAYLLQGITNLSFTLGANPFVIEDADAPSGIRQIKSTEKVLLTIPQDSLKCAGWGSTKPIPDEYILDESEIAQINNAIESYNTTIQTLAAKYTIAFVDMRGVFEELKTGFSYDGLTLNTTFITGGAFSLDGIHFTPRGNAIIANKFIETINAYYGSNIPKVVASNYRG